MTLGELLKASGLTRKQWRRVAVRRDAWLQGLGLFGELELGSLKPAPPVVADALAYVGGKRAFVSMYCRFPGWPIPHEDEFFMWCAVFALIEAEGRSVDVEAPRLAENPQDRKVFALILDARRRWLAKRSIQ